VKNYMSAILAVLFVAGATTVSMAQTTAPAAPPAEKKAAPKQAAPAERRARKNASGVVKSLSADTLVVTGKDKGADAEWTFTVGANTRFRKAGETITPGDVKPGDPVQVRYTEDGGKAMAQAVLVRPAGKGSAGKDGAKKSGAAKPEEKPAPKKP
jgi:hypothetical protein